MVRRSLVCWLSFGWLATSGLATEVQPTNEAAPLHELIDAHIRAACEGKSPVAPFASDAEFVRRAYLDLNGVIPEAAAALDFIESSEPEKRAKLVEALVSGDAFAKWMAVVFDVMLMERRPDNHVSTSQWRVYLADSFAGNKPLDVLVREILSADGTDPVLRPAAKFYLDRNVERDTLVRDIGRLLLGADLQCAQCHDHPTIGDFRHEHYHGLAVFVAGSSVFREPDGRTVLQEAPLREVSFASVFSPDAPRTTGPRLMEGAVMDVPEFGEEEAYLEKPSANARAVPKFSLRALLAETLPRSDEFTRNMANRLWAMMMGRGLVHPLDMHHAENAPALPELLDLVSARLASAKFNVREFLRELALSETYQRSSTVPEGTSPDAIPAESFAVANMKALGPEQLFDSLLRATGSGAVFEKQIESALAEDAASYEALKAEPAKLEAARAQKRDERLNEFIALYGALPGTSEGEFQASLPQALFFANSDALGGWIQPGEGNLTERIATGEPDKIAAEAYLSVLSRLPSEEEIQSVREHLAARGDRPAAVVELVWSLLASAEFRLNH
jgi:hypothetical protein